MDDYANHPKSIAEMRAAKEHNAAKWTVRDALIAALREIDSGKFDPKHCVLAFATIVDDKTHVETFNCFPATYYGVGMLQEACRIMLEPRQ